jgi:hypothetical protein
MLQELIIVAYILSTLGYGIEIYHLCYYGEDKHTNVCLWTANGGASIFAFVYCFENKYTDLMILFIIQYCLCFLCLLLNIYCILMKMGIRTYRIEETALPPPPNEYDHSEGGYSFEIEKDTNFTMANPLHKKRGGEMV